MFEIEQTMYNQMALVLNEEFQKVKTDVDDPDRAKRLSKCIADHNRLIRTKDTMCRRENIERRGYDTNARIAEREHKQKQEAEKNAKNNTSPNEEAEQSSEIEQLNDEESQQLTHLHPDMEQYQSDLPKQEDKKQALDSNCQNRNKSPDIYQNGL